MLINSFSWKQIETAVRCLKLSTEASKAKMGMVLAFCKDIFSAASCVILYLDKGKQSSLGLLRFLDIIDSEEETN